MLVAAANIAAAHYGPSATPYIAFAAIGPILTLRDRLQDAWQGQWFVLRIGALIAAGGLLSYLLTPAGGKIALASMVAFVASEATDTVVYTALRNRALAVRVNVSNAVSGVVDSVVFLGVAFGSSFLAFGPVFHQFTAKVAGGALFLALLVALREWRSA